MLGRKRVRDDAGSQPSAVLHRHLRDLTATNQLPATRVQELVDDIRAVAPGQLPGLPRFRGAGRNNNAWRNLSRAFLRGNRWPQPYWAQVRCRHVRSGEERQTWLAFGLPHEYIALLHKHGDEQAIMDRSGLDPLTLRHLQRCEAAAGARLCPLGLWGDGVPVQWDRAESIETLSLNLPGQSGQYKSLRLSLVSLSRKHISAHTWWDIGAVLAWSFRACATGVWPTARHDGADWLPSDCKKQRGRPARRCAQSIGIRSALCEIRADWKFFAEVFKFPAHNLGSGHCWMCRTTPAQVCKHFYDSVSLLSAQFLVRRRIRLLSSTYVPRRRTRLLLTEQYTHSNRCEKLGLPLRGVESR